MTWGGGKGRFAEGCGGKGRRGVELEKGEVESWEISDDCETVLEGGDVVEVQAFGDL